MKATIYMQTVVQDNHLRQCLETERLHADKMAAATKNQIHSRAKNGKFANRSMQCKMPNTKCT